MIFSSSRWILLSVSIAGAALAGQTDHLQQCRTTGMTQIYGTDNKFYVDCEARNGAFQDCYLKKNVAESLRVTRVALYQDGVHAGIEKTHANLTVPVETLWQASRCGITTGYTSEMSSAVPALKLLLGNDVAVKEKNECTIQYDAVIPAAKDKDAQWWQVSDRSDISCNKEEIMYRLSPRVEGVDMPDYLELTEPNKRQEKIKLTGCSVRYTFSGVKDETVTKCTRATKLTILANGTVKTEEFKKVNVTLPETPCPEFNGGYTPAAESSCIEKSAKRLPDAFSAVNKRITPQARASRPTTDRDAHI